MKVLVPLAQNCEEIEAVTVIDILRRAGIAVVSAGLDRNPVKASRGVVLLADSDIDAAMNQDFDMIVLPGGAGVRHLAEDPRVLSLLKKMDAEKKYVAAICAAPMVLAKASLLEGRTVACYPGTLEPLNLENTQISSLPVCVDKNMITSRGPGTAMDFALRLVEILAGKSAREEVEAGLVR